MYKNMYPIGTIIRVIGAERFMMITGRIVTAEGDDTVYDYCGCLYPEGITGADSMFFFNRDAIDQVYFIGFQDAQEIQFKTEFLNKLGKVEVVNGEL
ncbi:MAG: DUF4176 domain-containing protein, partial [Lachnospiraceae bacterium]|nr:DUF4176 domain-containing protein [Lachnospiraceae bacterium]